MRREFAVIVWVCCLVQQHVAGQVSLKISSRKKAVSGHNIFLRQPDGKFIYFTATGGNFYSGRLFANGNNDDAYNGARSAAALLGSYHHCRVNAVTFDKWNRVLVAGTAAADSSGPVSATMVRYTRNGDPDPDFAPGVLHLHVADTSAFCGVHLLPDERIFTVGSAFRDGNWRLFCARLQYNGEPDTTLGGVGYQVDNSMPGDMHVIGSAMQEDGKIVVAARADAPGSASVVVARYYSTGVRDTMFGIGGNMATDPAVSGVLMPQKVLLQPDGKIVVSGACANAGGGTDIFIMRLTAWGVIDSSFSADGIDRVDVAYEDRLDDMVLLPDGRFVLSGAGNARGERKYSRDIFLRYSKDGIPDEQYGYGRPDGKGLSASFSKPGCRLVAHSIALAGSEARVQRFSEMISDDDRETLLLLNTFLLDTALGVIDVPNRKDQRGIYPVLVGDNITFSYELIDEQKVTVRIRDAAGKEIAMPVNGELKTDGEHTLNVRVPVRSPRAFYEMELTTSEGYRQVVEITH